jgi:hypothetical protein
VLKASICYREKVKEKGERLAELQRLVPAKQEELKQKQISAQTTAQQMDEVPFSFFKVGWNLFVQYRIQIRGISICRIDGMKHTGTGTNIYCTGNYHWYVNALSSGYTDIFPAF